MDTCSTCKFWSRVGKSTGGTCLSPKMKLMGQAKIGDVPAMSLGIWGKGAWATSESFGCINHAVPDNVIWVHDDFFIGAYALVGHSARVANQTIGIPMETVTGKNGEWVDSIRIPNPTYLKFIEDAMVSAGYIVTHIHYLDTPDSQPAEAVAPVKPAPGKLVTFARDGDYFEAYGEMAASMRNDLGGWISHRWMGGSTCQVYSIPDGEFATAKETLEAFGWEVAVIEKAR